MKDIVEALKKDERLLRLVQQMILSDRMRAAAQVAGQRVAMLDALELSGFPVNDASILILFDGKQVTSVLTPNDMLQIRGGGFVPFTRIRN